MEKQKLTPGQLIKHFDKKNVSFNCCSKPDALNILTRVNYYFKLASYRVNFSKDRNGRYINLDFAYLVDLASIDMQLREYLLQLSLDIEHGIKVILNNLISSDPTEDAYQIIIDFKAAYPEQYSRTINYLKHNSYSQDMYKKYHENIPFWVFIEIMTFGTLSYFIDFYVERANRKKARTIQHYLKFSKNIRNACAHNNPLIINLFTPREFLLHPSAPVTTAAKEMNIPFDYLHDLKINDLVSLFYLHKRLQSKKMGIHKQEQGRKLIKRFNRHKEWYADNSKLNTFFEILNKLIDYLSVE